MAQQELAISLIADAMFLSSLVSAQFESVANDKLAAGLDLLNKFLFVQTAEKGMIPYYEEFPIFFTIPGQEQYFLPDIITVTSVTFYFGTVRYQMIEKTRDQYFATSRANNIQTLPSIWHFERALDGGNLFLYPKPNIAYEMHVWCKKEFDLNIQFNFDLTTVFEPFYIEYIRYGLAQYICDFYNIATPYNVKERLDSLLQKLSSRISPKDFSTTLFLSLGKRPVLNWPAINLSNGWVT